MRGALLILEGKKKGDILPLNTGGGSQTVVGRDIRCDIQIDDSGVSRRHFCILEQEGSFYLQDAGSSNGTFVNGQKTLWQEIKPGTKISCGATKFQFLALKKEENEDTVAEEEKKEHNQRTKPLEAVNMEQTGLIKKGKPPIIEEKPADILFQKEREDPPFSKYSARRLSEALSTLYKVLELLNSEIEFSTLLEKLLETVLKITNAERGCVLLKKTEDAPPETVAFQSIDIQDTSLPISRTIVNLAIKQGLATISSDAMSDSRFCKDSSSSVVLHNIRAVMCVPLEGRKQILGAIYVDTLVTCYAFTNDDLDLLRAIGRQAGLAVERTLLQDRIRQSEHKYRTIFEKAPFGIALISQSGRILDANPIGLSCFNLENQKMEEGDDEFAHSILDVFPYAKYSFQNLLHNNESFELKECNIHDPEGNSLILHLKGIPLVDENGLEAGMVIAEDITEAKRMQSQIIHQDKMATVGLLAAGVAHEFNNIIAGMMGYAQLILKRKTDNLEDFSKVVVQQCRRAREVIERLLNFSQRKNTPKVPVKLEELLEDVFQLVRRELLKNHIQIIRQFDDISPILAQPGQIQQIFLNLVINAMHAMKGEGILTVSLREEDGNAFVVFQDTGVGIPANLLPRIFEPFFTTKTNHGTGLGLAVSYSIIQKYGGEIDVESEENKGTIFTIRFPIASEENEGSQREAEE